MPSIIIPLLIFTTVSSYFSLHIFLSALRLQPVVPSASSTCMHVRALSGLKAKSVLANDGECKGKRQKVAVTRRGGSVIKMTEHVRLPTFLSLCQGAAKSAINLTLSWQQRCFWFDTVCM